MTVLLRDAIKPNLLQTLEGGAGVRPLRAVREHRPRQQLASSPTGSRSRRPTSSAPRPASGPTWAPRSSSTSSAARPGCGPTRRVIVATIRALKMHGGVGRIVAGKPLDPALLEENVEAVRAGGANLAKQIENVALFDVPVVVAINSFPTDTPAEIDAVREVALAAGARDAVVARHFARRRRGRRGPGAPRSGRPPRQGAPDFQLLYPDDGAAAREDRDDRDPGLRRRRASTSRPRRRSSSPSTRRSASAACRSAWPRRQYWLSHDPTLLGRPTGFRVPIREVRLSAGAGFVTPLAGEMRTMPGLPLAAGRRDDRHRRRREHRRAVLTGLCSPRDPRPGRSSSLPQAVLVIAATVLSAVRTFVRAPRRRTTR